MAGNGYVVRQLHDASLFHGVCSQPFLKNEGPEFQIEAFVLQYLLLAKMKVILIRSIYFYDFSQLKRLTLSQRPYFLY